MSKKYQTLLERRKKSELRLEQICNEIQENKNILQETEELERNVKVRCIRRNAKYNLNKYLARLRREQMNLNKIVESLQKCTGR